MRKKALLRAALRLAGVIPVRWRLLPRRLYCFTFHRVGEAASTDYSRNIFSCTAGRFEEHVAFLKQRFELLDLPRLEHLARGGHAARRPLGLITFDDGYVDNYRIAFPMLRRQGAPAVFFLPTAFIGSCGLPWWEEIPWMLRRSTGKQIRLIGADEPFLLRGDDGERSIRGVMTFVKSRRMPLEEQVAEVREACGGIRAPAPEGRLFMNWDEAREMHAAGMGIGAHTHTHRILAALAPAGQREELATSKEVLEGQLGAPVTSVAYPVGSRAAYTPQTCEIAASLGYRLGFNFLRRDNPLPVSCPLDIGRLAVSDNIDRATLQSAVCFPRLFAE